MKALDRGDAAVEIVRFEHHDGKQWSGKSFYVALVLNSQSARGPTLVKLGEATEIEGNAFADYEDLVTTKLPDASAGAHFYQAVWEPLKGEVKAAKRIFLAADGVLNQVSWAGVPTDNGRLLNDVSTINVVISTRDLLRQKHALLVPLLNAEAVSCSACELKPLAAVAVPPAGKLNRPRIVAAPFTFSVLAGVVVLTPSFAVFPVPDWKSTELPILEVLVHRGM